MIIRVGKELDNFEKLQKVSPSDLKLKESWIQDLIVRMPTDIVGEPLLVVAREFAGFGTKERPDIMAVDDQGNLVVVELKRGEAHEDVATQAVKYAAYCKRLKPTDILEIFRDYVARFEVPLEAGDVREVLTDFVGGSEEALQDINRKQRIILVANSFDDRVSAFAVWLIMNQIDLRCVKLNMFRDESGSLMLHPEQYLPTPEITSYLPGLRGRSESPSEDDIRNDVIEPLVQELVSSLPKKLRSSPFDPRQVEVYRRGWQFRVKMFGKNRAGYYFAKKWLRFYLYLPSQKEVEFIQSSISDRQSVNNKEYDVGFNVRTQKDVELLVQILARRFENHGEAVEETRG